MTTQATEAGGKWPEDYARRSSAAYSALGRAQREMVAAIRALGAAMHPPATERRTPTAFVQGRNHRPPDRSRIPMAQYLDHTGIATKLLDQQGEINDLKAARDRALALHRAVEHRGGTICAECSALDDQGSTDNAPVAHPCATVQALDLPETTS